MSVTGKRSNKAKEEIIKKTIPKKVVPTEIEKSKAALKAAKEKIEKKCSEEFQELLKKHNCEVILSGHFDGPHIEYGLRFRLKA